MTETFTFPDEIQEQLQKEIYGKMESDKESYDKLTESLKSLSDERLLRQYKQLGAILELDTFNTLSNLPCEGKDVEELYVIPEVKDINDGLVLPLILLEIELKERGKLAEAVKDMELLNYATGDTERYYSYFHRFADMLQYASDGVLKNYRGLFSVIMQAIKEAMKTDDGYTLDDILEELED